MVRPAGLEPARSPTRPSNVRVCLFRQGRISYVGEPYHSIIRIYTHFVNKIFSFLAKKNNNNTSCLHSDPFVVFLFAKLPSSDRWPFRTFPLMSCLFAAYAALVHVQQSFEVFPLLRISLTPLLPAFQLQQLVLSLFFSIHFWWNHSLSFLKSSLIISLSILSKFTELFKPLSFLDLNISPH